MNEPATQASAPVTVPPMPLSHPLLPATAQGKSVEGETHRIGASVAHLGENTASSAGITIDTLGRHFNPLLHPRDARGRFIETGGVVREFGGGIGKVTRVLANGKVEVQHADGTFTDDLPTRLTMIARPDGSLPTTNHFKVIDEDHARLGAAGAHGGMRSGERGDGQAIRDFGGPNLSDASTAETMAARAEQHAKPFGSVNEVEQGIYDSQIERRAGENDLQFAQRAAKAQQTVKALTSTTLSRDGQFLIGKGRGGWVVIHPGTGMRIGQFPFKTKTQAMHVADHLGDMQVNGHKFDWSSPGVLSRFDHDARAAMTAAIGDGYSYAGKADEALQAEKTAKAATFDQAKELRAVPNAGFPNTAALREHLRTAFADNPDLDPESKQAKHAAVMRELAEDPSLELLPGGLMLSKARGKDAKGYQLSDARTGLSLGSRGRATSRAEVIKKAKAFADVRDADGHPFDWTSEGVQDRLNGWRDHQGRRLADAADAYLTGDRHPNPVKPAKAAKKATSPIGKAETEPAQQLDEAWETALRKMADQDLSKVERQLAGTEHRLDELNDGDPKKVLLTRRVGFLKGLLREHGIDPDRQHDDHSAPQANHHHEQALHHTSAAREASAAGDHAAAAEHHAAAAEHIAAAGDNDNAPAEQAPTDDKIRWVRAGDLAKYAVHDAGQGGEQEHDADKQAEVDALRRSIEEHGVQASHDGKLAPIKLSIDPNHGTAHIGDGNHRTMVANSVDPDMLVPVVLDVYPAKRRFASAKHYDGEFNDVTPGRHDEVHLPSTHHDGTEASKEGRHGEPDTLRDSEGRGEVLAHVPAQSSGDDHRPATVLPGSREPGARPGQRRDGQLQPAAGSDRRGEAGRGEEVSDAGSGGRRDAGSGVPAAGARDAEQEAAGDVPARVGRGRGRSTSTSSNGTGGSRRVAAGRFTPNGQQDLARSGQANKLEDNLAALRTLRKIQSEGRTKATPAEQKILARWAGWGSLAHVITDGHTDHEAERDEIKKLLGPQGWQEAKTNLLNAHYTDANIVDEVWGALKDLGFSVGDVLEPGSGSGNFIGRAPHGAHMTGVELNEVTASISRLLYPDAEIHHESFGGSPFREGVFDAVIGNVPFGNFPVHDPKHNPGNRHSIHNHFILKSVHSTKPGGVVAVITSTFSLDGPDNSFREKLYKDADLLGAVRLPSGAHRRTAGTDVTTDVLVLRRRKPGEKPGDDSWLHTAPARHADGSPVLGIKQGDKPRRHLTVNDYFTEHPENVLGTVTDGGYNGIAVKGDGDVAPKLADALHRITDQAKADGRAFDAAPDTEPVAKRDLGSSREGRVVRAGMKASTTKVLKGAKIPAFKQYENGKLVDFAPQHESDAHEVGKLLDLRDAYAQLRDIEARTNNDNDPELVAARQNLNRLYDEYVAAHGPITRYKENVDATKLDEDGNPKVTRTYPGAIRAFRNDEGNFDVFGLEHGYDADTNTATKADVFNRRQIDATRDLAERTDDPQDAIALTQERGEPLTYKNIAARLGITPAEARKQTSDLLFEDHDGSGRLVPRADYLSGNVRTKLREAEKAAETNPELKRNVAALKAVLPRDAELSETPLQMGSTWVGPDLYQKFAQHLMGPSNGVEVSFDDGQWNVATPRAGSWGRNRAREFEQWGTEDRNFYQLLQLLLRQQHHNIQVWRKDSEGGRYLDKKASEAAVAKADEIAQAFIDWAYSDADTADALTSRYNERFRAIVPRSYDHSPVRAYPGMTQHITLNPHQNDAVTRATNDPTILLEHEVGAGKTYTLAGIAMELKRLGMVKKPVLTIPAPLLSQWNSEIKELYPDARVLAVDSESLAGKDARRRFAAKVAASDWDLVVMTGEAFESIPVSEQAMRAYFGKQLDAYEEQLRRAKGDKAKEKKIQGQIEKAKAKLEEQVARRIDPDGITFEKLGLDYILADEAHRYKNLDFHTLMQGVQSPAGSGRARDMDMKLQVLRDMKGDDPSAKIAAFATGTPISNSLAEMYTMTRFLRPDLLDEAGISDFDAWAATFARVEAKQEMDTAGAGYQTRTRMRGFTDALGDALRIWRSFSDTKTADDLGLKRPKVKGGNRQIHVVQMTEAQRLAKASFKYRVDTLPSGRPQKGDDTHVAIIGDGRRAALDARLMSKRGLTAAGIDPTADTDSPKVEAMANRIADIWEANKDNVYKVKHDSDEISPNKGALQLAFIDSDAPKAGEFSSYQLLKDLLVERGMDPTRIRFIQEVAGSASKKAKLQDDARQGKVDLIIGATESLGTGTNVQNRLIAVHHGDGSWKPSDIVQREGRIIRQGNQHPEVELHAYVTQGTHDEKVWDMVSYKQAVLDAIARGDYDMRAVEFADDVDPLTDFDTLAGSAALDPLRAEQREVTGQIKKLEAAARSHANSVNNAKSKISQAERMAQHHTYSAKQLREALPKRVDTAGDKFAMVVKNPAEPYSPGVAHVARKDAAVTLGDSLHHIFSNEHFGTAEDEARNVPLGRIGGFHLFARPIRRYYGKRIMLALSEDDYGYRRLPFESVEVSPEEINSPQSVQGVISRLEKRIAGMEDRAKHLDLSAEKARQEKESLTTVANSTFSRQGELDDARKAARLLDRALDGDRQEENSNVRVPLSPEDNAAVRDEYEQLKAARRAAEKAEKKRRADELAAKKQKDIPAGADEPTMNDWQAEKPVKKAARKTAAQLEADALSRDDSNSLDLPKGEPVEQWDDINDPEIHGATPDEPSDESAGVAALDEPIIPNGPDGDSTDLAEADDNVTLNPEQVRSDLESTGANPDVVDTTPADDADTETAAQPDALPEAAPVDVAEAGTPTAAEQAPSKDEPVTLSPEQVRSDLESTGADTSVVHTDEQRPADAANVDHADTAETPNEAAPATEPAMSTEGAPTAGQPADTTPSPIADTAETPAQAEPATPAEPAGAPTAAPQNEDIHNVSRRELGRRMASKHPDSPEYLAAKDEMARRDAAGESVEKEVAANRAARAAQEPGAEPVPAAAAAPSSPARDLAEQIRTGDTTPEQAIAQVHADHADNPQGIAGALNTLADHADRHARQATRDAVDARADAERAHRDGLQKREVEKYVDARAAAENAAEQHTTNARALREAAQRAHEQHGTAADNGLSDFENNAAQSLGLNALTSGNLPDLDQSSYAQLTGERNTLTRALNSLNRLPDGRAANLARQVGDRLNQVEDELGHREDEHARGMFRLNDGWSLRNYRDPHDDDSDLAGTGDIHAPNGKLVGRVEPIITKRGMRWRPVRDGETIPWPHDYATPQDAVDAVRNFVEARRAKRAAQQQPADAAERIETPRLGALQRNTAKGHGLGDGDRAWVADPTGTVHAGTVHVDKAAGISFTPDHAKVEGFHLGGVAAKFRAQKIAAAPTAQTQAKPRKLSALHAEFRELKRQQELRAEAATRGALVDKHTGGDSEELRRYYGEGEFAGQGVEPRLTWPRFLEQRRAERRYADHQQASYDAGRKLGAEHAGQLTTPEHDAEYDLASDGHDDDSFAAGYTDGLIHGPAPEPRVIPADAPVKESFDSGHELVDIGNGEAAVRDPEGNIEATGPSEVMDAYATTYSPEHQVESFDGSVVSDEALRDAVTASEQAHTPTEVQEADDAERGAAETIDNPPIAETPDLPEQIEDTPVEQIAPADTIGQGDTPKPAEKAKLQSEADADDTMQADFAGEWYAKALDGEGFDPTPQQAAIYRDLLGKKNLVVVAKAGTGKTTTLEGAARRMAIEHPGAKIGYGCFNASTAEEAVRRMPDNTDAVSTHGLAMRWSDAAHPKGEGWRARRERPGLVKLPALRDHYGVREDVRGPGGKVMSPTEQVQAAKNAVDKWATTGDDAISLKHFGNALDGVDDPGKARVLELANKMWADISDLKNGQQKATFDHARKAWALAKPDFSKPGWGFKHPLDVLFVDEAQDSAPVWAKVIADQTIPKVVVGDPDQAINGFTGAINYLDQAAEGADSILPLSKSFRYGPHIAAVGNRFLTLLNSRTRGIGAGPDGQILDPGTMSQADAVLTRTNAGMLGEVARELGDGRVVSLTKGTKNDLLNVVATARWLQGIGDKPAKISEDLEQFDTWGQVLEAADKGDDPKLATLKRVIDEHGLDGLEELVARTVEGQGGALSDINFDRGADKMVLTGKGTYAMAQAVKKARGGKSLHGAKVDGGTWRFNGSDKTWAFHGTPEQQEAALDDLRRMLGVQKPDVTISTAHKAKGLEWDRVRIGDDFKGPAVDPNTGEKTMPSKDELMLAYVASTRAKRDLDPGSLSWVFDETTAADESPFVKDDHSPIAVADATENIVAPSPDNGNDAFHSPAEDDPEARQAAALEAYKADPTPENLTALGEATKEAIAAAKKERVPTPRTTVPRPQITDAQAAALEDVLKGLRHFGEEGASPLGLKKAVVDKLVDGGYLVRSDTGNPDSDSGPHRVHLTEKGAEALRGYNDYAAARSMPPVNLEGLDDVPLHDGNDHSVDEPSIDEPAADTAGGITPPPVEPPSTPVAAAAGEPDEPADLTPEHLQREAELFGDIEDDPNALYSNLHQRGAESMTTEDGLDFWNDPKRADEQPEDLALAADLQAGKLNELAGEREADASDESLTEQERHEAAEHAKALRADARTMETISEKAAAYGRRKKQIHASGKHKGFRLVRGPHWNWRHPVRSLFPHVRNFHLIRRKRHRNLNGPNPSVPNVVNTPNTGSIGDLLHGGPAPAIFWPAGGHFYERAKNLAVTGTIPSTYPGGAPVKASDDYVAHMREFLDRNPDQQTWLEANRSREALLDYAGKHDIVDAMGAHVRPGDQIRTEVESQSGKETDAAVVRVNHVDADRAAELGLPGPGTFVELQGRKARSPKGGNSTFVQFAADGEPVQLKVANARKVDAGQVSAPEPDVHSFANPPADGMEPTLASEVGYGQVVAFPDEQIPGRMIFGPASFTSVDDDGRIEIPVTEGNGALISHRLAPEAPVLVKGNARVGYEKPAPNPKRNAEAAESAIDELEHGEVTGADLYGVASTDTVAPQPDGSHEIAAVPASAAAAHESDHELAANAAEQAVSLRGDLSVAEPGSADNLADTNIDAALAHAAAGEYGKAAQQMQAAAATAGLDEGKAQQAASIAATFRAADRAQKQARAEASTGADTPAQRNADRAAESSVIPRARAAGAGEGAKIADALGRAARTREPRYVLSHEGRYEISDHDEPGATRTLVQPDGSVTRLAADEQAPPLRMPDEKVATLLDRHLEPADQPVPSEPSEPAEQPEPVTPSTPDVPVEPTAAATEPVQPAEPAVPSEPAATQQPETPSPVTPATAPAAAPASTDELGAAQDEATVGAAPAAAAEPAPEPATGPATLPGMDELTPSTPTPAAATPPTVQPVADQAEVGGQPAEWVTAATLTPGDAARVAGFTEHGEPATVAGYVTDAPTAIESPTGRGGQVLAVPMASDADGNNPVTVYTTLDALAARADGITPGADGAPPSLAAIDAHDGLPERMPTDTDGAGVFPGSTVNSGPNTDGIVTAIAGDTAIVKWPGQRTTETLSADQLRTVDQKRPEGWTNGGVLVRDGQIARTHDGVIGTVTAVDGDNVHLTGHQGDTVATAAELEVISQIAQPTQPATQAPSGALGTPETAATVPSDGTVGAESATDTAAGDVEAKVRERFDEHLQDVAKQVLNELGPVPDMPTPGQIDDLVRKVTGNAGKATAATPQRAQQIATELGIAGTPGVLARIITVLGQIGRKIADMVRAFIKAWRGSGMRAALARLFQRIRAELPTWAEVQEVLRMGRRG